MKTLLEDMTLCGGDELADCKGRARLKRLPVTILLLLPVVAFVGWFAYEQLPAWTTPAWLQPTNPDAPPGACDALASLRLYRGAFASGAPSLAAGDARERAMQLVSRQYDRPGAYAGSALVRATFSEAGERLAWLSLVVLAERSETQLARAAIIYLDAETGDLLALVTAAAADDPQTACGGGPVSRRALVRLYLPLLLAGGYVVLLGIGIGARRYTMQRRKTS